MLRLLTLFSYFTIPICPRGHLKTLHFITVISEGTTLYITSYSPVAYKSYKGYFLNTQASPLYFNPGPLSLLQTLSAWKKKKKRGHLRGSYNSF